MFDYPELKSFGRLKVAERSTANAEGSAIILHGYGANAYDLWSLQSELQCGKKLNWYFPDAPIHLEMGMGYSGRAWFPINERALERAMRGEPLDYSKIYPPGLDRARDLILEFIASQKIEPKKLVLGGFSQGAMLSIEVALHLPEPPKALLLFSGTLANAAEWKAKAEKLAAPLESKFEFFQSHGNMDAVLPFAGAERLRDVLEEAGWKSNWQEFDGGHEIPANVLKAASFYLRSRWK